MNQQEALEVATTFQKELFRGNVEQAGQLLADDAVIEGFFPHQGNKKSFLRALQQAIGAMGDVRYQLTRTGRRNHLARLTFRVAGKHITPLDFSFMKLPVVPPSLAVVSWPTMQWEYTITDGKITRIRTIGSLQPGMLGILRVFGVPLPKRGVAHFLGRVRKGDHKRRGAVRPQMNLLRLLPLVPLLTLLFITVFVPSPIDAAAWAPQSIPAWVGALAPNSELTTAERLGLDQLTHPEDIVFDREGRLYTGSDDGTVYRVTFNPDGSVGALQPFARLGGYPLGLAFDQTGNLLVAAKDVGLLSLDPMGQPSLLTNSVDDSPITYANSLAITGDGTVYFSDSSRKHDRGWPYDVLEARPNGRLLAYSPETQRTVVVKDGLYFPNGLTVSPDGAFLLVNETTRFRIVRYWLKGDKQGTWDVFADNLPLMPDNISVDEAGSYLLAGVRRIPTMDTIQSNAWLKNQLAKLPLGVLRQFPTLKQNRYGLVLILGADGQIKRSLHDPTGRLFGLSSARSHNGYLYLSTLLGSDVARYPYQEELTSLVSERRRHRQPALVEGRAVRRASC